MKPGADSRNVGDELNQHGPVCSAKQASESEATCSIHFIPYRGEVCSRLTRSQIDMPNPDTVRL